jgi:isopentenyldiphosphate isomerase
MEFFDVLDEQGNKTGEIIERNEAHKKGICHRVIQVWFINSKKELLLQKRSANKESCPNMWCVSVGGHNISIIFIRNIHVIMDGL